MQTGLALIDGCAPTETAPGTTTPRSLNSCKQEKSFFGPNLLLSAWNGLCRSAPLFHELPIASVGSQNPPILRRSCRLGRAAPHFKPATQCGVGQTTTEQSDTGG